MTHPADRTAIDERERQRAKAEKLALQQLRADTQQVMNTASGRRLVSLFMDTMGMDASSFSTNAMQMARSTGLQDAAKWWQNLIREHCPEKEQAMRREYQALLNMESTEEEPE